jgi:hypothetical protein
VRLEDLAKFKKFSDPIGYRNHDLPACSSALANYATANPVTIWIVVFLFSLLSLLGLINNSAHGKPSRYKRSPSKNPAI